MANVRITDFTNYTTILSTSDVIPIVDVTNNVNKKITIDNLFAGRSSGGVNATGTVTSVALTVPQGMAISPTSPITTSGTLQLSWSGQIPLSNLATNPPSSSLFLRGDGTWAPVTTTAGTVNFVGLSMPSVFQVVNSDITTSGIMTVLWDTLSGGKIPPVNLGGDVPTPASSYYLRADGTWANPTGIGIGTVSSVTLTTPQGLLVNGAQTATNTNSVPFVLSWDNANPIPLGVIGANTPTSTTFLRGDGWNAPAIIYQSFTPIQFLGTLASTSAQGTFSITLTGQYTNVDIYSGLTIYFGANATLAYTVASVNASFQTTTITFTTALQEVHFIGASVYKYGALKNYNELVAGSYLVNTVTNNNAVLQNVPTPSSWLTGSLIPVSNQGATGQYFYTTSNQAIYLKTNYNEWRKQEPLEIGIDKRTNNQVDVNIGARKYVSVGSGYTIIYSIYVQPVNLTANVVIQGFKYITTNAVINSVNLTLQAPPTGWTLANYDNLALSLQMAINALPDALPVTVTNDDSNLELRVRTAIPSTFTSPNPPTVGALTPTSVQSGSYLSNITVKAPVGAASVQNVQWTWAPAFKTAFDTAVLGVFNTIYQVSNVFRGTLNNPTNVLTPANPSTGYTLSLGDDLSVSGDRTAEFPTGTRITFSLNDYNGYRVNNSTTDLLGGQTIIDMYPEVLPAGITTSTTVYIISNYQAPLPANTNLALIWAVATNTLTNLSYNTSTGVFTNTSSRRIRVTMSADVYVLTSPPTALSNQASIWFQLNNTTAGDGASRRGQYTRKYQGTAGTNSFVLTTSWTFSLAPGDTLLGVINCDRAFYVSGVLGSSGAGYLEVVEV